MERVFEAVDNYIDGLLAQEDAALLAVIQSLEENDIPNICVSPVQGKFLQVMAASCNAKNILELGTLTGYSTIWLARALPPDGKLITIEFEEKHAAIAQKNIELAGLGQMVDVRVGSALDILPQLEAEQAGPFDLIFIDADKPPYTEYFQWALRLARPGTVIIADNVIRNGKVLDPASEDEKVQGVQRFNKMLGECNEVTAIILQTVGIKEYDGMAVAIVNHKWKNEFRQSKGILE